MSDEDKVDILPDGKHKILIVDDEEQIRDMFKLFIETDFPEMHVDVVANGAEAVQSFGEGRHSILLMDLHMPIMDGGEAFREIEDLCDTMDWQVPTIIFCTAFDPPCDINRVLKQYERAKVLKKPISNSDLIDAVKEALV